MFEFARLVLDTAEREEVMRVIETPTPWRFNSADGWTWLECARARFEREGYVVLFPGGGPTRQTGGRLRLPARLAYYKEDVIVEEDVEDVGELRRIVVTGKGGDEGRCISTPAIGLDGDAYAGLARAPGRLPTRELYVRLSLDTDIWFPRVLGLGAGDNVGRSIEGRHPARGRDGLMDNSALAARHTPRLNRLVETLRDAILELGGTWDKPDGNPSYAPMVHDGGILLDYPAASA